MNKPSCQRDPLLGGRQSGVTLIELIVGIVVLGMVVATVSATLVASVRDPVLAREISQANFVAQRVAESVLQARRAPATGGFAAVASSSGSLVVDGRTYSYTTTVTQPGPGASGCPSTTGVVAGDCKLVVVAVTVPTPGAETVQVQSTLLLTKYK